jgi:hypothetical protein
VWETSRIHWSGNILIDVVFVCEPLPVADGNGSNPGTDKSGSETPPSKSSLSVHFFCMDSIDTEHSSPFITAGSNLSFHRAIAQNCLSLHIFGVVKCQVVQLTSRQLPNTPLTVGHAIHSPSAACRLPCPVYHQRRWLHPTRQEQLAPMLEPEMDRGFDAGGKLASRCSIFSLFSEGGDENNSFCFGFRRRHFMGPGTTQGTFRRKRGADCETRDPVGYLTIFQYSTPPTLCDDVRKPAVLPAYCSPSRVPAVRAAKAEAVEPRADDNQRCSEPRSLGSGAAFSWLVGWAALRIRELSQHPLAMQADVTTDRDEATRGESSGTCSSVAPVWFMAVFPHGAAAQLEVERTSGRWVESARQILGH